ncbi:hypothetical protein M0N37_07270 [Aeromonas taiwanensis]|nr:hypothetical protein [Aeromonas taiwanensis]MCO4203866.1 hypothetical protein [Aeromonas taiwanensis]
MMRVWRGCWVLCCCGLWALPLRAEVKVVPVFEAEAMVQTLKELYPDLGVSAMGNQLVLSGSAAQLQEAEATLNQLNQPPQSLLIEWRVDGASSSGQAGIGIGNDNRKRQWLIEGGARDYQRTQQDNWRVRGLSGRPVLLQMGSYQPVTFYQWQGGRVVGMMPLVSGLYATATLIGDRVQVALSSEQARLERGNIRTGQSATEVSGAPGQWLTVGELSTTGGNQEAALSNPSGIGVSRDSERQTLQIRVTRQ